MWKWTVLPTFRNKHATSIFMFQNSVMKMETVYEDECLLACYVIWYGRFVLMLKRNLVPTSPTLIMKTASSSETSVHITRLHGVISQKTVIFTVPLWKFQFSRRQHLHPNICVNLHHNMRFYYLSSPFLFYPHIKPHSV